MNGSGIEHTSGWASITFGRKLIGLRTHLTLTVIARIRWLTIWTMMVVVGWAIACWIMLIVASCRCEWRSIVAITAASTCTTSTIITTVRRSHIGVAVVGFALVRHCSLFDDLLEDNFQVRIRVILILRRVWQQTSWRFDRCYELNISVGERK